MRLKWTGNKDNVLEQLADLKLNALQELEGINSIKELESWRVHCLGRTHRILESLIMKFEKNFSFYFFALRKTSYF